MEQVFTSYSRRDQEMVDAIVARLSQAGIDVWIDRSDIKAGDRWRVQIVKAIKTSPAFVLMLSPSSAESNNVRKEIDLSQGYERPMFPVMLQRVRPLPDEISYQLAGEQIIDVEKLGIDNAVGQLIETLKEYLKKIEPVEEPATQQVELVIQGIDLKALTPEKQQQLLDFMATLTSADRSQMQITKIAAGSVHVFVDMPTDPAYELLTLALNQDPRFKELGIVSLRLEGDKKFVNVSTGKLALAATVSPLMALWLKVPALFSSVLGATGGKIATLVLAAALVAGAGTAASKALAPVPVPVPSPTSTSTLALTATVEPSSTIAPTETSVPTETATATLTPTETLTSVFSPSPIPTYLTLRGVPTSRTACNYGPGNNYLYQEVMNTFNKMSVFGKALIYDKGKQETWLYIQGDGYKLKCFVNAADVQLTGGGLENLQVVYPGGDVKLPGDIYKWPAPKNVEATRQGDQVYISWDFFNLPLGEREDDQKPRYMLELWLCKNGELQFTPTGSWDATQARPTVQVTDEVGCPEPSHGRIYLADKHGYKGPTEIPWPAYPAATATP
ncbi:MAG: TIR domain-containing protein [Bacteroidota bacterium]